MSCPLCSHADNKPLGKKDGYTVVACRACGLRYVREMPALTELSEYYAAYHGNAKNVHNAARKVGRWRRKLLLLKLFARGKEFLDVGCNTGFAVEAARQLGFHASGCDLSSEAIALARAAYPGCHFEHGTAQTAAAAGRRYDTVLCAEMIEHLTELQTLAEALSALVKPGGILFLTTPNARHFLTPKDFLSWKEVCPPHHLIYFAREQIKTFLDQAGFNVSYFLPMLHKPSIRVMARRR